MGISNEGLWQEALTASEDAMNKIDRLAQLTPDAVTRGKLEILASLADALLTELENVHSGKGAGANQ